MDLFDNHQPENLLPLDGNVRYYGRIINQKEAANYYDRLYSSIEWRNDEVKIFGNHFITNRKVAWYGDLNYEYTYSNATKMALPWTPELRELKNLTEKSTGEKFNSCLLNLYHSGEEGMGWHSDDEKSLRNDSAIASLSFGAERKFSFRHKKSRQTLSIILETGSLLLMKGPTQTHWLHALPKSKKILLPRINLTFRSIHLY